jgi:DNA-binding response OmpR family regulator
MRVLVVEDDQPIRSFVARGLRDSGHAVEETASGTEALSLASASMFDAAVVDLTLPDLDGLDLIQQMRGLDLPTAIVVLSARRSVEDRVTGLRLGADDYLAKPFAMTELLARLEAVTRRSHGGAESVRYDLAGVTLDTATREVMREGQRLELTPREFALLARLMAHAGRPVPKTMLTQCLWSFDFEPQTNVVDVLVCRLRAKVDRNFDRKLIRTLRGVGYVFQP